MEGQMQMGVLGQISQQAASIPNPALDAEEINILLSERIPECRKMLAESSTRLQQVADYCEENYKNAINKHEALEETKSFTVQSLASVAYQVNVLADCFLNMFARQSHMLSDLETTINHVEMAIDVAKEKAARREIAGHTDPKPPPIRVPHARMGMFQIDPMQSVKYTRRPIDYSVLDDIGHGIRDSNAAPVTDYASVTGTLRRQSGSAQGRGSTGSLPGPVSGVYAATGGGGVGPGQLQQGGPVMRQMGGPGSGSGSLGPGVSPNAPDADKYGTLTRAAGVARQSAKTSIVVMPPTVPGFPQQQQQQQQPIYMPSSNAPSVIPSAMPPAHSRISVTSQQQQLPSADYENPPSMAGAGGQAGAQAGQRATALQLHAQQASDERSASPPLPPPPPEMVRSVDDLVGSAGFPAPPTPGLMPGPAQGQNQNEFAPGLVPPPAGAGGRQSWILQQQQLQQQAIMGIGGAVAGFRQSQLAQQQLAFLQQQQQLLQDQAAAVGVSSPAAQQLAGPWKARSPRDPEWAPPQYLDKVVAIYDYSQANADELSIMEGQTLYVLKKNDDDWWDAITLMQQQGGGSAPCRGLIPSNYLEISRE